MFFYNTTLVTTVEWETQATYAAFQGWCWGRSESHCQGAAVVVAYQGRNHQHWHAVA